MSQIKYNYLFIRYTYPFWIIYFNMIDKNKSAFQPFLLIKKQKLIN